MANPKRASMREGPLAALFRKTEDLEKGEQPAPEASIPHPALSASQPQEPEAVSVPSACATPSPRRSPRT
jgi:cell division protein FtsZ